MIPPKSLISAVLLQFAMAFTHVSAEGKPDQVLLVPGQPIPVVNSHAGFDFIEIDSHASRLLAPHTKNGTFDIFALGDGALTRQCPLGATQAVAVDQARGKYYVTGSNEPRLIVLDSKTGEITGQTPLPGPADILTFDSKTNLAYVGHDDGTEVWVVDVVANKICATIAIPEKPEGMACDPENHRMYVNACKTSEVVVIDTVSNQAINKWPTAPAVAPHGLVLDKERKRLYVAGSGKLVALDTDKGQVTGTADIAQRVDQIAFDPALSRIYCASGTGVISVVEIQKEGLTFLGNAPTHAGAHSVAVDPVTHSVWTAYGTADSSFILKLSVAK